MIKSYHVIIITFMCVNVMWGIRRFAARTMPRGITVQAPWGNCSWETLRRICWMMHSAENLRQNRSRWMKALRTVVPECLNRGSSVF